MEGMLAEGIVGKGPRFQKMESSTGSDSDSCSSPEEEHTMPAEDFMGIALDLSDNPVEEWKSRPKGAKKKILLGLTRQLCSAHTPAQMTTTNSASNHIPYT